MIADRHAEWFLDERGISRATLEAWGIASDGELVKLTYPGCPSVKIRKGIPEGERKMWWDPPLPKDPLGHPYVPLIVPPDGIEGRKTLILCEGETDVLRTWQALEGERDKVNVVGLSGLNTWREDFVPMFEEADRVYVVLDNDDPYKSQQAYEAGNAVWRKIRADLGMKARRVRLPSGVKDLCEFFERYPGLAPFKMLLKEAAAVKFNYPSVDFTGEPPEIDWLWDGMIAKGDFVIVAAPPGIGKSWLTMALAMGVAEGWPRLLGRDLRKAGRVLYVDQENPEDIVRRRIQQLGRTEKWDENSRYLSYAGVRIDEAPDLLLEDIYNWSPELVVIDSLSAVHRRNENLSEEMTPMFQDAIEPICRKLGVTVVMIHHYSKQGNVRGSSALEASADAVFVMDRSKRSGLPMLKHSKFRRGAPPEVMVFEIVDRPDGSTALERKKGVDISGQEGADPF